jgi:hypothetical protein
VLGEDAEQRESSFGSLTSGGGGGVGGGVGGGEGGGGGVGGVGGVGGGGGGGGVGVGGGGGVGVGGVGGGGGGGNTHISRVSFGGVRYPSTSCTQSLYTSWIFLRYRRSRIDRILDDPPVKQGPRRYLSCRDRQPKFRIYFQDRIHENLGLLAHTGELAGLEEPDSAVENTVAILRRTRGRRV